MEAERRYASAHLVTADGKVYSGGVAVAPLLDLLPGGAPLSHAARLVSGPLSLGYGLVARNRGLLGRPLSAQATARALEQIERHGARHRAG
jgi:predicted DCC family thiol-disulfide oxidoreductase YuxK